MNKHTWIVLGEDSKLRKHFVLIRERICSFVRVLRGKPLPPKESADNGWVVFGSDGKGTPVEMNSIEKMAKFEGERK